MRVETLPLSEHAVLTAYLHSDSPDLRALEAVSRPAIIICPGGRYAFCADVERDVPAISFFEYGTASVCAGLFGRAVCRR